jgi:hypothetical protein
MIPVAIVGIAAAVTRQHLKSSRERDSKMRTRGRKQKVCFLK